MDPPFLPQNVVLHPDDATNKVFLAVARAFVAVDNRAMTIKDIADTASRYGLVCQNLSAAAQAVTTYLRSHKVRCDTQQDQPLLLSHALSGTTADDDLVAALYSRSGGDSHPLPDRLTNFRKGTAVWYLSRATGLPCPFARAGIRLSDYITLDDLSPDPIATRPFDQACGHKRKRPLRACVARPTDERPPKVKLTLRLKPLALIRSQEYDSDDMSVDSQPQEQEEPWSLPPYPRPSISIPSYTPASTTPYKHRSPSIVEATPPPESEDESDDFHVTMQYPVLDHDDVAWDADDSEGEGDTAWESPGPRSPSAPLVHPALVAVKEEPRDVQGMLDAWEDFDSTVADSRVAFDTQPLVKLEPLDPWDWDAHHPEWPEDTTRIKQEDFDVHSLFPQNSPPPAPASSPSLSTPTPPRSSSREPSVPSTALVRLLQSMSVSLPAISTNITLPPPTPCVSPLQTRCQPSSNSLALPPPVVVTTCHPCKPAISATQIEDISVYQMMLGAFQLLRRIDTDFVNLSPIVAFSGSSVPHPFPNATVVTKGSPEVSGTWVPLSVAQAYVRDHLSSERAEALEVFLSDTLVERFPSALQDFHQSTIARGLNLNQFGRHFASTLQAAKWEVDSGGGGGAQQVPYQPQPVHAQPFLPALSMRHHHHQQEAENCQVPLSATEQQLFHELCVIPDEDMLVDVGSAPVPLFEEPMSPLSPLPPSPLLSHAAPMTPLLLSPKALTFDADVNVLTSPLTLSEPEQEAEQAPQPADTSSGRPLRRSKRVADALSMTAVPPPASRTRSRKSASRSSFS